MKLYFVRHGRTLWNQEGRFQGASGDSPLLPESIETLKRLGQYLEEIPFDQIYSSDLPRAVKSDGGLANASLTIIETHDFETFTLNTWNDTSYQS